MILVSFRLFQIKISIYSLPSMTSQKLRTIGLRNALIFLVIGALLYAIYYQTSANFFIYLEYAFIFIAGAINFILLLRIFNHVKKHKRNRTSLLVTSGVIILSLVGTLVFFRFMMNLQDTMRIKFINVSSSNLTSLKVVGCEKKFIDQLKPGRSRTVWIRISRICSISISYIQNGVTKTEVVSAYIEPSNGSKLTFSLQ